VSPVQYLQTCRLLLAKNLLTGTNLSVLDVAMTAGFGSLRRFNDLFKKHYRLSPRALRKELPEKKKLDKDIRLYLEYRPPYRFAELLDFLRGRAVPGVEHVTGHEYSRTIRLKDSDGGALTGWVRAHHEPRKNALAVGLSEGLLPIWPEVKRRLGCLFDLDCDPERVYERLASMNEIRPGLFVPGTRLPGSFCPFEMAVRAVLGQQITVKAARTLAARLVGAFGSPIETGIPGLTHAFPSPQDILALDGEIENRLGPLGIFARRARTIGELAKAFTPAVTPKVAPGIDAGAVPGAGDGGFGFSAEPEEGMKKLLAIPGIGNWTARYIAMRALGWTDAFLETDAGIKKALEGRPAQEMLRMAEGWRPWRSYATISLWNSLKKEE